MNRLSKEDLSEGAQEIVELIGHEGEVSTIIEDHPELIEYLDEYIEWRDKKRETIGSESEADSVTHGLQSEAEDIASEITDQ